MQKKRTVREYGAQVIDLYYEMLIRGLAPMLDVLFALCPDEPLGPPEGWVVVETPEEGEVLVKRREWEIRTRYMNRLHPGYQPGYRFREKMKYGNRPEDDAPLAELVRARINHAKALWCGDLEAGRTKLQFPEWLPFHVDWDTQVKPLWPDDNGWSEALQLIRIACGLPRFVATSKKPVR
jgi:hypothetical protein